MNTFDYGNNNYFGQDPYRIIQPQSFPIQQALQNNQMGYPNLSPQKYQAAQTQFQQDLQRIEQLEKELSNILDNAEQTDFETIYRIYSNIINNAELASKQIPNDDPLKKQWYKQVLLYQIKEKKYRDKLQKLYFNQQDDNQNSWKEQQEQKKLHALKQIYEESMKFFPNKGHTFEDYHSIVNDYGRAVVSNNSPQKNKQVNSLNYQRAINEQQQLLSPQRGPGSFIQSFNAPQNNNVQYDKYYMSPVNMSYQQNQQTDPSQIQTMLAQQTKEFFGVLTGLIQSSLQSAQKQHQNFQQSLDFNNRAFGDPTRNSLEFNNNNGNQNDDTAMKHLAPQQEVQYFESQNHSFNEHQNDNLNNDRPIQQNNYLTPQIIPQLQLPQIVNSGQDRINSFRVNGNPNEQPLPGNQAIPVNIDNDLQKEFKNIADQQEQMIKQYQSEIKKLNDQKQQIDQKIENSQRKKERENMLKAQQKQSQINQSHKQSKRSNQESEESARETKPKSSKFKPPSSALQNRDSSREININDVDQETIRERQSNFHKSIHGGKSVNQTPLSKNLPPSRPWASSNKDLGSELKGTQQSVRSSIREGTIYNNGSSPMRPQFMNKGSELNQISQNSRNTKGTLFQKPPIPTNSHDETPIKGSVISYTNLHQQTRVTPKKLYFGNRNNGGSFLKSNQDEEEDPNQSSKKSDSLQLFIVEKPPYLKFVNNDPERNLADEEEVTIGHFDQVMMENCDFEKIVNKEMIQKQFDVQNDVLTSENIYQIIEDYYNSLMFNNYVDIQQPIFGQLEVSKKLKQISAQLLETNAYRNILNGNTAASLYKGLDDAFTEMGLPSLKDFIKMHQAKQVNIGDNEKNNLIVRRNSDSVASHPSQMTQKEEESKTVSDKSFMFLGQHDSDFSQVIKKEKDNKQLFRKRTLDNKTEGTNSRKSGDTVNSHFFIGEEKQSSILQSDDQPLPRFFKPSQTDLIKIEQSNDQDGLKSQEKTLTKEQLIDQVLNEIQRVEKKDRKSIAVQDLQISQKLQQQLQRLSLKQQKIDQQEIVQKQVDSTNKSVEESGELNENRFQLIQNQNNNPASSYPSIQALSLFSSTEKLKRQSMNEKQYKSKVPKIQGFSRLDMLRQNSSPVNEAISSTIVSLQKNVQFLLNEGNNGHNKVKQQGLPPLPQKQNFVKEYVKYSMPDLYKDRVFDESQEKKINQAVEEIFKSKQQQSQEQKQKYYLTNEEMYKKFNFNDSNLDQKFHMKNQRILLERAIKDEQEKPSVQKFVDKLKKLENPFISQLFLDKAPKEAAKRTSIKSMTQKKIQLSLSEIKGTLDEIDQRDKRVQMSLEALASYKNKSNNSPSVQPFQISELNVDLQKQYLSKSLSTIRSHNDSNNQQSDQNTTPFKNQNIASSKNISAQKPTASKLQSDQLLEESYEESVSQTLGKKSSSNIHEQESKNRLRQQVSKLNIESENLSSQLPKASKYQSDNEKIQQVQAELLQSIPTEQMQARKKTSMFDINNLRAYIDHIQPDKNKQTSKPKQFSKFKKQLSVVNRSDFHSKSHLSRDFNFEEALETIKDQNEEQSIFKLHKDAEMSMISNIQEEQSEMIKDSIAHLISEQQLPQTPMVEMGGALTAQKNPLHLQTPAGIGQGHKYTASETMKSGKVQLPFHSKVMNSPSTIITPLARNQNNIDEESGFHLVENSDVNSVVQQLQQEKHSNVIGKSKTRQAYDKYMLPPIKNKLSTITTNSIVNNNSRKL